MNKIVVTEVDGVLTITPDEDMPISTAIGLLESAKIILRFSLLRLWQEENQPVPDPVEKKPRRGRPKKNQVADADKKVEEEKENGREEISK